MKADFFWTALKAEWHRSLQNVVAETTCFQDAMSEALREVNAGRKWKDIGFQSEIRKG